ncbi:TetR/AcrR family transcriptional regulator [Mycobacterium sp.]|uniref:TetR/AcrR family transcriptional regulator n=1 Tax=Mycobacterium sp. TaxID=1785 RepID=UPI003D0B9F7C
MARRSAADRTYHRGDLRETLLAMGIELARAGGPEAVSLRDVQRRAGVSNSAAYRHYADRDALLVAISEHAAAQMARTMEDAMQQATAAAPCADPGGAARSRFRATGAAYLDFALTEPGLFATVFLPDTPRDNRVSAPHENHDGDQRPGPYQLLIQTLDDMVATGALDPAKRAFSDVAALAAVHGLAVLLLHGPFRGLDEHDRHCAIDRLLDVVEAGTR